MSILIDMLSTVTVVDSYLDYCKNEKKKVFLKVLVSDGG